jgi:hypothetical protein
MKLFEFLKILTLEKFPFRLDYEVWSGNVKVIVDTFNEVQEFCFDEDGITEITEFQEIKSTEDSNEINSKIEDLKDRPLRSWIDASKDLGIKFIHPYKFKGLNGNEYEVTGLLPEFGSGKGMLITDRKSDDEAVLMADLSNEYGMTGLSPRYYDQYDRESFIETLSEWGWIGDISKKPKWIKDN